MASAPKPSEAALAGVAVGVALSQFVLSSEAGAAENIIQVGAPILLGAAVANIVAGKVKGQREKYTWYLQHAAVAGAVGTIALMAAGALPTTVDAATLGFAGLVGASVALGDLIVEAVDF